MIEHKKYNPTSDQLKAELGFMYKKYEELCRAYKDLASRIGVVDVSREAHDMSHMTFKEEKKEIM